MEMKIYRYPDPRKPSENLVLWASRHEPLQEQLRQLAEKFGSVTVVQVSKKFANAEEIMEYAEKFKANVIVPVLPLSMIARLVELASKNGKTLLWAEMEVVEQSDKPIMPDPEREVVMASREPQGTVYKLYRFKKFHRIKAVKVELEPF